MSQSRRDLYCELYNLMEELFAICEDMNEESYGNWRKRILDATPAWHMDFVCAVVEAVDKHIGYVPKWA